MVADYVASVVGQFGAGTFQVREVILDVVLERLKGHREAFVEGLTNLGVVIIDREMAEQVVFVHSAAANGRWCGDQRPPCGLKTAG